jgi:hypothetical protein
MKTDDAPTLDSWKASEHLATAVPPFLAWEVFSLGA